MPLSAESSRPRVAVGATPFASKGHSAFRLTGVASGVWPQPLSPSSVLLGDEDEDIAGEAQ